MENNNSSSLKKIIITLILTLILHLIIGIIIGIAFGIYYGINNPDLDKEGLLLLLSDSILYSVLIIILGELVYFLMVFVLKGKKETIIHNKFSLKNLNIQLIISIVGFAICFIFISSEIENIISLFFERPAYSHKFLFVIAKIEGSIGFLITIALVVFLPAFIEEIFFRGIIQSNLTSKFGVKKGIIITSIFFSIFHLYPSVIVPIFILSLMFGYLYYKTNNLFYPIFLHLLNNFIIVIFVRFDALNVSGLIRREDPFEHVNLYLTIPSLVIIVVITQIIFKINHSKNND